MARYINTKEGLKKLLERLEDIKGADKLPEYHYWVSVVKGCIEDNLAMDEIDYGNAPDWFRPLWRGLN